MNPDQLETLDRLKNVAVTLDQHFFDLIDACPTDAQKRQVVDAKNLAALNYVNAVTNLLNADDAELSTLLKAAKKADKDVQKAVADLTHFKDTLNQISGIVHEIAKDLAFLA